MNAACIIVYRFTAVLHAIVFQMEVGVVPVSVRLLALEPTVSSHPSLMKGYRGLRGDTYGHAGDGNLQSG